jgi:hypothetical protein
LSPAIHRIGVGLRKAPRANQMGLVLLTASPGETLKSIAQKFLVSGRLQLKTRMKVDATGRIESD